MKINFNFQIWHPETLQIDSILLLTDNHYFTMVEENFEIYPYNLLILAQKWLNFKLKSPKQTR